ncbi:MAG: hypothetical protein RIG61_04325 [Deltaproteobacteria bacterium]
MRNLHHLVFLFIVSISLFLVSSQSLFAQGGDFEKAPPGGNYKKVSSLVELPDFIPGLGVLYVDPGTLPAGPFLAYDRDGNLVSSVYMVPLKDLNDHKAFENLNVAQQKTDHVDLYYNAGHPGVPVPHYHIVLWYVSPEKAEALKQ